MQEGLCNELPARRTIPDMSILRSTRRKPALIGVAVVAAAVLVIVLVWFQPQKLIIDSEVNEALPGTQSPVTPEDRGEIGGEEVPAGNENTNPEPRLEVLAEGDFRSLAHPASGRARLLKVQNGETYLRLEDFMVENGPDLRVYLAAAPSDSPSAAFGSDFIDLGALKGNAGDQNYRISSGVDLDGFKSAVIWCRRFSVGFAVAPIAG